MGLFIIAPLKASVSEFTTTNGATAFGSASQQATASSLVPNTTVVTDPDPNAWNTNTVYVPGQECTSPSDYTNPHTGETYRNVYVFLPDDDTGNYATPASATNPGKFTTGTPRIDTTSTIPNPDHEQATRDNRSIPARRNPYWSVRRRINIDSLLDRRPTITASRDEEISFVLSGDGVSNAVGLINLNASFVSLAFDKEGSAVDIQVPFTDLHEIQTWEEYFFRPLIFPRSYIFRDLPSFSHPEKDATDAQKMKLTLRNPGTKASLGQIVYGFETEYGSAVMSDGFEIAGLDFSTLGTDTFGVQAVTERPNTRTMKFSLVIRRDQIDATNRLMEGLSAGTPSIFFLTKNDALGTTLYGWVRTWRITMKRTAEKLAVLNVTIQGFV